FVRMSGVVPAELGEHLPALELEARTEVGRRQEGLFELDRRLAVERVDAVDHVRLGAEPAVDGAAQAELDVLQREATLARVVRAGLQELERAVAGGRCADREQAVE